MAKPKFGSSFYEPKINHYALHSAGHFLLLLLPFVCLVAIFINPIYTAMARSVKSEVIVDPATRVSAEATTKKTRSGRKKEIKYSDKSEGQPELVVIFDLIKSMMKPYAKGTLKERGEKPGIYNLVSEKEIEAAGRKFDEIYFASIIVQKGYVGFYYMPVYSLDGIKQQLKPGLLKCLKGKACFHIKKNDPVIMTQINEALATGYECYKEKGWIE